MTQEHGKRLKRRYIISPIESCKNPMNCPRKSRPRLVPFAFAATDLTAEKYLYTLHLDSSVTLEPL